MTRYDLEHIWNDIKVTNINLETNSDSKVVTRYDLEHLSNDIKLTNINLETNSDSKVMTRYDLEHLWNDIKVTNINLETNSDSKVVTQVWPRTSMKWRILQGAQHEHRYCLCQYLKQFEGMVTHAHRGIIHVNHDRVSDHLRFHSLPVCIVWSMRIWCG
jgi:hypothetical protein